MKKLIHRLRSKDAQTKRDILNICMIVFVLVLFSVWVYSTGDNLTNPDTQTKFKQDLQPFGILKDDILGGSK